MHVIVENEHEYFLELHSEPAASGLPLWSDNVTADLGELIDETYTRGVFAEKFPAQPDVIRVRILPIYRPEPVVAQVQIELIAGDNGKAENYCQRYATGRWVRSSQWKAFEMREAGTLTPDQTAYRLLVTLNRNRVEPLTPPLLQPPPIEETTLESCGVGSLNKGSLEPDRPVLVLARLAADAVRCCEEAGSLETGGAVLGKIVRLPKPLPGAETRIVTILSSLVEDHRHAGMASTFNFSPEALVEAARIGDIRGLGESVLTVFHTHGWSSKCHHCSPKIECPLPTCSPSLQDYELLSLFPSKGTLIPIAGRKPGAQGDHPVLHIHAWRSGQLQAVHWQQYGD